MWEAYCAEFSRLKIDPFPRVAPNWLQPYASIKVSQDAPVIRLGEGSSPIAQMRFGWPSPRGAPVFNMRSEGRAFSRRCIVPATAFFEFTEPPGWKKGQRKTRHRFTMNGAPVFGIAATWRSPERDIGEAFSMLTTAPGPDVAPIHDRQIVLLEPESWTAWTRAESREAQAELLKATPAGALSVETVVAT